MADFNTRIWDNERIYMVGFGRARARKYPHRSCPDLDILGFHDDDNASEHGPIVGARVGQGNVKVRFYRTEISTNARLYARPADGNATIRMVQPTDALPAKPETTLVFRPRTAGRTAINIHYKWQDGPILGRLYVDVRDARRLRVQPHFVTIAGVAPATAVGSNFLGQARPAASTEAAFQQKRIRDVFTETIHVFDPHGIRLQVRPVVNSNWTSAQWGTAAQWNATWPGIWGAGPANAAAAASWRDTWHAMRAMALSPNRSATNLNVYFADLTAFGAGIGTAVTFVGLGPPVAWVNSLGFTTWPDPVTPGVNHLGSGILVDTNATPFTGTILAHEFGHILQLASMDGAGQARQWHTIGDPGVSRDDMTTRRRLMYPYTGLQPSSNGWRMDVGYGNSLGALLIQRQLTQDETVRESRRAYDRTTAANLYAA